MSIEITIIHYRGGFFQSAKMCYFCQIINRLYALLCNFRVDPSNKDRADRTTLSGTAFFFMERTGFLKINLHDCGKRSNFVLE